MALFNKKSEEKEKKSTLVLKDEKAPLSSKESPAEKPEKITVRAVTKKYKVSENTILKKPLISEKNFRLALISPKYVFEVSRRANKLDIKKAFFNIYGLMPRNVNVMHGGGQATRFGRSHGTAKLWKKAIITLKKGEKLDEL